MPRPQKATDDWLHLGCKAKQILAIPPKGEGPIGVAARTMQMPAFIGRQRSELARKLVDNFFGVS